MASPIPGQGIPRRFSRAAGVVVAVIGGVTLMGWALGVGILRSGVPGLVEMKANTAACFVLAGIALMMPRRGALARAALACSGLTVALGLATLAEYLSGRGLGIDELLFRDPLSVSMHLPPGRMATATAAAFVMTGAARILAARRERTILAQWLVLAAVLFPLFSFLAYLFDARAITMMSPHTSLAINTVLAFFVLGAGILSECTDAGPMAVMVARDPGGTTVRRLLPLSVGITLLLGFLGFSGARAGLYSHASGTVLFAVVTSVALAVAIWVNAWLLGLADAARRGERERFRTTLASLGDAVIASDRLGRVQFMNPVAEALTGWGFAEAEGSPLGRVFRIVDEASRAPAPNPVDRVLATGALAGLADHTLLIARDGSERPIDDTAAPIKDARGETTGVVLVFRDVGEKRLAEGRLRASEERFRMLFDAMEEGFCVVEMLPAEGGRPADCRFLEVNPAFERQSGLRDAQGRRMRELAPGLEDRWFEAYGRVAETGESVRIVDEARALGGRWLDVNAFPVGVGERRRVAILFRDVTTARRADEDRERLLDQLRENDRRKDEFLAMLAHELRNPLAAIGNALRLASGPGAREHVDWSMELIARQAKHLTRLIDDLLDVARISRGKIELRREPIEATAILEGALASVGAIFEARGHAYEAALDRGRLWVHADPTRLEQVVVNLLNNAAKYSGDAGWIKLSAAVEGGELVIAVQDRGQGMPPESLPVMFDLFAQGDRSLARSEGGLGIGLTLVKKLVELHGGGVTAHSDGPGKGSRFTARLPAIAAPSPGASPPRQPPEPGAARRSRILVVDDNVDMVRGMSRLLSRLGHDVATAYGGVEALDAARSHRPEFVLLDIGLPGMNGYEVAEALRRGGCGEGVVLVAVSGYGGEEDRRRSKEAGFDHHFLKPVDHDALLALLAGGGASPPEG